MLNWRSYFVGALTAACLMPAAYAYGPSNPATLAAVPANFAACGTDGKVCKAPAGANPVYVVYGAGSRYAMAQGTGDFTCYPKGFVKTPSATTPQDLGVDDPVPNVLKTCYIMTPGTKPPAAVAAPAATTAAVSGRYGPSDPAILTVVPATFTACGTDGKVCKAPAGVNPVYVLYGTGNRYATAQGAGDFTCYPKGFVKTPSATTPQDLGVDDPVPNAVKTCYIMTGGSKTAAAPAASTTSPAASPAVTATTKDKPPRTPTDPVQWVIDQAKKRKGKLSDVAVAALDKLMAPTKGVFLIEESEEDEEQEKQAGAIIAVKGKFNWVRGFAAAQGSAVAMSKAAKKISQLVTKLGASDTVPMEVTLYYMGDALDLEIALKVVDTWKMTGELMPVIKSRLALKELNVKMHAKLPVTLGAPSFSVETEGAGFAKITQYDSWVGLTPAVEFDNQGAVTMGGAFSGTCTGEPNKDTDAAKDCKGAWDVFKMGRINATGGSLRITMEGPEPVGLEASIKNGRLGPPGKDGIEVTGAIRGEAKLKPGFGLVLKTSGKPTLMDFINLTYGPYMNAGGELNPLNILYKGMSKLPNPKLPLSQAADIIITPTGFVMEDFNYPDPQIYIKARAEMLGIGIGINSEIKGNPGKFLSGDITGGMPKGHVKFKVDNDGFNSGIQEYAGKVPGGKKVIGWIMDNGFTFRGLAADLEITNTTAKALAWADFRLFGKDKALDVPLNVLFDPEALLDQYMNYFLELVTLPPQVAAEIDKLPEPYKSKAKDGLKAFTEAEKAYVKLAVQETKNQAKAIVLAPVNAVKSAGGAVVAAEQAAEKAVATAVVNKAVSLFGGGGENGKDLLNQHVSPFGAGRLTIQCATEHQRCVFEGTRDITYGYAGKVVVKKGVVGGINCDNGSFGSDPAPGEARKSCSYEVDNAADQVSVMCAKEHKVCHIEGKKDVAYGAGNQVAIKSGVTGDFVCNNDTFGTDPAIGADKACYYKASNLTGTKCADENKECWIDPKGPPQDVYFGGASTYAIKTCQTKPVVCNNYEFGIDPARTLSKACYKRDSAPGCATVTKK